MTDLDTNGIEVKTGYSVLAIKHEGRPFLWPDVYRTKKEANDCILDYFGREGDTSLGGNLRDAAIKRAKYRCSYGRLYVVKVDISADVSTLPTTARIMLRVINKRGGS